VEPEGFLYGAGEAGVGLYGWGWGCKEGGRGGSPGTGLGNLSLVAEDAPSVGAVWAGREIVQQVRCCERCSRGCGEVKDCKALGEKGCGVDARVRVLVGVGCGPCYICILDVGSAVGSES
jgi:hypothetical protein